ncbi:hypothetical protein D3C87_2116130 [compost metagenome]
MVSKRVPFRPNTPSHAPASAPAARQDRPSTLSSMDSASHASSTGKATADSQWRQISDSCRFSMLLMRE